MPVQALPLILLAEAMGMSIPIFTDYYKAKGIDLSGYDAQDIVPLEVLYPEKYKKEYKTWDESFYQPKPVVGDTDLSGVTAQMSEAEARSKGMIIPPDPTVSEEDKKRGLVLPNIPPEIEQGWVEEFPIEESKSTILSTPVLEPDEQGSIETLPFEKPDIGSMILTSQTEGLSQEEKKPPFYSKVKKVIEDAKMEKGTTDQWKGYIDNAGVNQAELDWIGLNDYLADKKSITKSDILNFVTMNDLAWQVQSILLGTESDAIKFTGDTMEWIEGQGTTLTHDPRVPEILRGAYGYEDAKLILANDYDLYTQLENYKKETVLPRGFENMDDEDWAEEFLEAEFGIVKGSSDQGKAMYNRKSLITEGDYTDYKEMIFQLPKNEGLMRDLENQIRDLQKEKNLLAETRLIRGEAPLEIKGWEAIKDEKLWHQLSDQQGKLQAKIDHMKASEFKSHYKYPNVFAHARFTTREIEGKKTLFIEELQSDWIHKGKKEGFKNDKEYYKLREEQQKLFEIQSKIAKEIKEQGFDGTAEQQEEYYKAKDRYDEIENILTKSYNNAVPDIPFKNNWQDVVLKRLIRYAAENDFDAIALAGGEIQADRYDLSKQVNEVIAQKYADGIHLKVYDKNDSKVIDIEKLSIQEVERYVGKELAEKIKLDIEKNPASQSKYSGLDLKVGGEGLKAMYDEVFSNSLKKIGKKFDADVDFKILNPNAKELFSKDEGNFDYTKTALKNVNNLTNAQSAIRDDEYLKSEYQLWLRDNDHAPMEKLKPESQEKFMIEFLKEDYGFNESFYNKKQELDMWFMDLTPSLKKQAIEAGFAITGLREGGIVEIPHFHYGGFINLNRL